MVKKQTNIVKIGTVEINIDKMPKINEAEIVKVFTSFVDTAMTATNRSTKYNTKEEQEKSVQDVHKRMFSVNRGFYAASLLLDGLTDYSKQFGVETLLDEIGRAHV